MNTLTSGEEAIMQIIWKLGPCTIGHIMEHFRGTKKQGEIPAQTTISTFLRILVELESSMSLIQLTLKKPIAFLCVLTYSITSLFDFTANTFFENAFPSSNVSLMYLAFAEPALSKTTLIPSNSDLSFSCFQRE